MAASAVVPVAGVITYLRSVKLIPPINNPITGITTSFTKEVAIAVNAPPMMTPTARSNTLPREINSLNSAIKPFDFLIFLHSLLYNYLFIRGRKQRCFLPAFSIWQLEHVFYALFSNSVYTYAYCTTADKKWQEIYCSFCSKKKCNKKAVPSTSFFLTLKTLPYFTWPNSSQSHIPQ